MKFKHWFYEQNEESNKIKHLFDSQGLILFFKKDEDCFGAGEDSRVVFAKMKNPDSETPDGWSDEATFTAVNLAKLIQGIPSIHVFSKNDIKKIKVIDVDKAVEEMKDISSKKISHISAIQIIKIGKSHKDKEV